MQIRRVVVVDDHTMFTEALSSTMSELPDLRVVGAFPSTGLLPARVATARPDVVTIDVEPFTVSGTAPPIERLVSAEGAPRVVVLTASVDPRQVVEAARAGAMAWLSKEVPTGELLATIRAVCAGHARFPAEHLGAVLRTLVGELRRTRDPGVDGDPLEALSGQERRILAAMVGGARGAEIAARLHLSMGTVRTHTQNIYAKLGVHSRLEAVTMARQAGR